MCSLKSKLPIRIYEEGFGKAEIDFAGETPVCKTVISADVCENDEIHPKTKHNLAQRVSMALYNYMKKN